MPALKNLTGAVKMNDVTQVADRIKKLGDQFQAGILGHFGQQLAISAQQFNIMQIAELLDQFPDVVQNMLPPQYDEPDSGR